MKTCEHVWKPVGVTAFWCENCGRLKDGTGVELPPAVVQQFNGLTLSHQELIIKLQEEHLEVAHVCSKILLYGFDDTNPVDPSEGTNRDRLHKELGDTKMFTWLLLREKLIDHDAISASMWAKLKVLPKWLKHYVITPELMKIAETVQESETKLRESAKRMSGFAQRMQDALTSKEREILKARLGVDDQGSDE